jgi:integrase
MSKYIINHDDPIRALSYSQISTFLRCRKQWEYSYRQNIVPSRDHTSLTIGRLVHAGMAGYWKAKTLQYIMGHSDISTTLRYYVGITDEMMEDAKQIMSS